MASFCSDKHSVRQALVKLVCRWKVSGTASLVFLAEANAESATKNRTKLCAQFGFSVLADEFILVG